MSLFDKMIKQGMDSVVGKTVDQLKQKAGQTVQEQLADKAGALADKLAGQVAALLETSSAPHKRSKQMAPIARKQTAQAWGGFWRFAEYGRTRCR